MAASTHWMFWASMSAVFAALTAVFAKAGLQDVDADFATLRRTVFILVLLATFVAIAGKWRSPATLTPATWGWLMASALATGASWSCYFRALKIGDAWKVAAVDKLSLLLVALFAVVFLHERLNLREWMGIALMTGGVLLLVIKR